MPLSFVSLHKFYMVNMVEKLDLQDVMTCRKSTQYDSYFMEPPTHNDSAALNRVSYSIIYLSPRRALWSAMQHATCSNVTEVKCIFKVYELPFLNAPSRNNFGQGRRVIPRKASDIHCVWRGNLCLYFPRNNGSWFFRFICLKIC